VALRAGVALAAAGVSDEFGLARDGGAGGESFEAKVVLRVDRLPVELGEEDVGDGANDALVRAFNQVAETHENPAFAEADGGVQRCEAAKANSNRRDWRPGTQKTILFLKYGTKIYGHQI